MSFPIEAFSSADAGEAAAVLLARLGVAAQWVCTAGGATLGAVCNAYIEGPKDRYAGADDGGKDFGARPEEHGDGVVDVLVEGREGLEFVSADYRADSGAGTC